VFRAAREWRGRDFHVFAVVSLSGTAAMMRLDVYELARSAGNDRSEHLAGLNADP